MQQSLVVTVTMLPTVFRMRLLSSRICQLDTVKLRIRCSSAPPSNQVPKERRQTQKRGKHDSNVMTSHSGHQQNHSTNELAASDIMSSRTSHNTSHRTTRSSGRIRARCNVDNAVSVTSKTHPRHHPVTKLSSIGPVTKKRRQYKVIVGTRTSRHMYSLRGPAPSASSKYIFERSPRSRGTVYMEFFHVIHVRVQTVWVNGRRLAPTCPDMSEYMSSMMRATSRSMSGVALSTRRHSVASPFTA